jgi:hypothetical protein
MSDMGSTAQSAYDIIAQTLTAYGLEQLSSFVNQMVFQEDIVDTNILVGRIRQTNEYRQRFAGNEQRRQAGLNVLSENEYIQLENVYRQTLRSAGMPREFYSSPETFSRLIGGDVSPGEFAQRINQGYEAVRNADPQVVEEMRRLYGVDDSQLAAYFLDPQRATPILLKQARAAEIAAQGTLQAGFGVTAQQAEELAQAGVTGEQARESFQTLATATELFQPLAGRQEEAMSQAEQVGAVFGTSGAAQQRLRKRQAERQAEFAGGGSFAVGQSGQSSIA